METPLPLSTLLSQVLVAFTIEFDNEFEHQMPHRTTRDSDAETASGLWLVSQVMWSNFMQFVDDEGAPLRDLEPWAAITNLGGLERWRYVVVEPDPGDSRSDPPWRDQIVRTTEKGRRAQAIWRPLGDVIEKRWEERFGINEIGELRQSLLSVVSRFDVELPDYLPVVHPTQNGKARIPPPGSRPMTTVSDAGASASDLSVLLSRALLVFTLDFESESKISLPVSANALRVLDETGVRIRDLPGRSGVSQEALAMAIGFLERIECVLVEPGPSASRGKVVRLTPKGGRAQAKYQLILRETEERWPERYGGEKVGNLRTALETLVDALTAAESLLSEGLAPYPDGWRAKVRRRGPLPHYPMVLHRGGFPDGS